MSGHSPAVRLGHGDLHMLSHAELVELLNQIPDPVFLKSRERQWIYVNNALANFLGREPAWFIGKTDREIFSDSEAAEFWRIDDEVLSTGLTKVNLEQHTAANGLRCIVETKKSRLILNNVEYLIGIIRDLTVFTEIQSEIARSNIELERKLAESKADIARVNAQLQQLTFFDNLTGLPNRRLLLSSLERRIQESPVALLYLDLDHFKRANDSHGHPFGDAMLVELATRLRAIPAFSFVARFGGDEFVCLTREGFPLDKISLAQACRDLLTSVSQAFLVNDIEASVSASVGIAVAPMDGDDVTRLLQSADNALYRAKERGRNQYAFFAQAMSAQARDHLTIERGLRRAIRTGDVQVLFQPIFSANSSQQVAVEALARWRCEELGDVSPERFIPIAESSGLIHELSHHVLRQALEKASEFLPVDQRLAVNLSALQLDRLTLIEDVRRALQESQFDASRLELEITESLALSKDLRLMTVLNALRDLGVGLSLDDFGTGFSALGQIQRLPIDRIKIDRSFVTEIALNPKSRAVVEAMIRMAHGLGLKVLAEGVETVEQRKVLRELGCDELQGFLLGRPTALG